MVHRNRLPVSATCPRTVLEEQFAAECFALLCLDSTSEVLNFVDGYNVSCAVTDGYAVEVQNNCCAVRLRAIPQGSGRYPITYSVGVMECADLGSEQGIPGRRVDACQISWNPYVLFVSEDTIHQGELTESTISILCAKTGNELLDIELTKALEIFDKLSSELYLSAYKDSRKYYNGGYSIQKNSRGTDLG